MWGGGIPATHVYHALYRELPLGTKAKGNDTVAEGQTYKLSVKFLSIRVNLHNKQTSPGFCLQLLISNSNPPLRFCFLSQQMQFKRRREHIRQQVAL